MKRLFATVLLSLLVVQMCLLPLAAEGNALKCPSASTVVAGDIRCFPTVTLPATDISVTSAILNGRLEIPNIVPSNNVLTNGISLIAMMLTSNGNIYVSFQYGTEPGVYTAETPRVEMTQSGVFQAPVTGLRPCATYYYRTKIYMDIHNFSLYQDNYFTQGAGVGLGYRHLPQIISIPDPNPSCLGYGDELSFQTLGCVTTGSHGTGGAGAGATSSVPSNMSNIVVQSATIATAKVSPGEKVDITASVANRGGSNGTSKVTLYINGQEAESKGVALSSGQSTTMNFSVSRNDPGTYSVLVNGVPAGSFTVDLFTNNDALIYGIIALFTVGIIGVLLVVVRRRTA